MGRTKRVGRHGHAERGWRRYSAEREGRRGRALAVEVGAHRENAERRGAPSMGGGGGAAMSAGGGAERAVRRCHGAAVLHPRSRCRGFYSIWETILTRVGSYSVYSFDRDRTHINEQGNRGGRGRDRAQINKRQKKEIQIERDFEKRSTGTKKIKILIEFRVGQKKIMSEIMSALQWEKK